MQLTNGHFVFSPSDITAFLACQHKTTLALQVARGEIEAPPFENEQADLVFRKGDEHEQAHLQREGAGNSVRPV